MSDGPLDGVDRQILHLLQQGARDNTNASIGEAIGIAPSTVGKRIARLEEAGVITGVHPCIDYGRAGFPLHVLFICSVPIEDRGALGEALTELTGGVGVTTLMTGSENIHVQVVGAHKEDITRLAMAITELGAMIDNEILIRRRYP